MLRSWKGAAAAAAILAAPIASAHQFTCEKTVDGQDVVHVTTYPTTVTYVWTITNPLSVPSTTNLVTDSVFFPQGSSNLPFTLPLTLAAGASVTESEPLTIDTYDECVRLANATAGGVVTLTNTLTVWFDSTSTTCDAQVVCHPPGEGCLTRTPGYWGTHPEITAKFLDPALESCGEELTTTAVGVTGSITEDLCSVGKDHKLYGSPQEAQLVRQCAAAALNIAASEFLGGSCEEGSEVFAECCASCGSVPSGCIEDLDEFNNSADTLLVDEEEINLCKVPNLEIGSCAADPGLCQAANGNGYVNDREVAVTTAATVSAGAAGPGGPTSGGCSGGPGGVLALLGTVGLLALHRRR